MEENVVITNIATILAKDILIDKDKGLQRPKHFLPPHDRPELDSRNGLSAFLYDDSSDEEAFTFFMRQREKLEGNKRQSQESHSPAEKPDCSSKSAKRLRKRIEVNLLNKFASIDFEGHLHMSKITFLHIFQNMSHLLLNANFPSTVTPQTVFSLSLWKLSTDEHFEQIARKFDITLSECRAIIKQYWDFVASSCDTYISWPMAQERTLTQFAFEPQFRVFQQLCGVVAIKRLDIFLERADQEVSVILQIVCNAAGKVIDCCVELEQIYSFDSTPIGKTLASNKQTMAPGSYLIGNTSLPLKTYLMRPFGSRSEDDEVKTFNALLIGAAVVAQEVLDAMAMRFNILYALEANDLNEVRRVVQTVCCLHNLCVDIGDDYIERRREVIKFNWASAEGCANIIGSETDEQGVKRRDELMNTILK